MKKIFSVIITVGALLIPIATFADSYDLENIYVKEKVESGTIGINAYGSEVDVAYLLVPTELKQGKYSVEITREDYNLYRICGTDIYIKTRYCYEYATRKEVIIVVESPYSYNKGKVVFLD